MPYLSSFYRFFLSACVGFLMSACGDDSRTDTPTAVLTAVESMSVPGRLELSSESYAGDGQNFVEQIFTVTNLNTNEVVFGPTSISENFDSTLFRIYPISQSADEVDVLEGDYTILLEVLNDAGLSDVVETTISLNAMVSVPEDSSCHSTCSLDLSLGGDEDFVACTANISCTSASLVDDFFNIAYKVSTNVSDSNSYIWLQAFGGAGGSNNEKSDKILGGDSGASQVFFSSITNMSTLINSDNLYYLIGEKGAGFDVKDFNGFPSYGGSSTLVANAALDGESFDNLDNMLLIAGGGGGAGQFGNDDHIPYGGAGGIAVSTLNNIASVAGADGGAGSNSGSAAVDVGGAGGNKDGQGAGGQGGSTTQSGVDGVGGRGGGYSTLNGDYTLDGHYSSWLTGSLSEVVIGEITTGFGDGGLACSYDSICYNGGGGGGYGGGASGQGVTSSDASDVVREKISNYGGGGGGSYAMASDINNTLSSSDEAALSGHQGNGDVVLLFDLSSVVSCVEDSNHSQLINCTINNNYSQRYQINELNLAQLKEKAVAINSAVNDETKVWLQVWGAKGGSNSSHSDSAGLGGFSQVIYSQFSELTDAYNTLYYYIGEPGLVLDDSAGTGGASSSILTSYIDQVTVDDVTNIENIIAIAGGGAGGAKGGDAGGDGGVAISDESGSKSVTGGNGKGDYAGLGGNSGGNAEQGSEGESHDGYSAAAGTSGVGGKGGKMYADIGCSDTEANFLNKQSSITTGKGGHGGIKTTGDSPGCEGGAGGGGYGGGGGGSTGGGGGGGSYTAKSTSTSTFAPMSLEAAGSPDDDNGQIIFVFELPSE